MLFYSGKFLFSPKCRYKFCHCGRGCEGVKPPMPPPQVCEEWSICRQDSDCGSGVCTWQYEEMWGTCSCKSRPPIVQPCELGKICFGDSQCGTNGKCKEYKNLGGDFLNVITNLPRANINEIRLSIYIEYFS